MHLESRSRSQSGLVALLPWYGEGGPRAVIVYSLQTDSDQSLAWLSSSGVSHEQVGAESFVAALADATIPAVLPRTARKRRFFQRFPNSLLEQVSRFTVRQSNLGDLGDLRREYVGAEVHKYELAADPLEQFQAWFAEACSSPALEPNAMALATVAANGQPSLRTVLLKYFGADGFVFFTNLGSAKAHEIAVNPRVALLFTWLALERQVIVKGTAARISTGESLKYFLSRPRGSQIGAWVSRQSSVITSRQLLESKFDEMRRKFREGTIPMPSFWGGYRVNPEQIEFWQGGPNRLHDRFQYTRGQDCHWTIERLAP